MARSLLPSYAKAVVGPLVPGAGKDLPDHSLEETEVEIDAEHLAAYNRVCGFGLRDTLPPTYPHILGFPLQMSLMTERAFPFALLGMVHVANRIDQRRPIAITDRPDLCVWAENLRPHRRGRQLDLVLEAKLDGEVVWLEHSTYLRRGKSEEDSEMPDAEEREEPEVTSESGALWDLPGDIGRRYADASGDRNPIHLHPLTARLFGFPRAIAHGMWTKARCLAALEPSLPGAYEVEVEFRS